MVENDIKIINDSKLSEKTFLNNDHHKIKDNKPIESSPLIYKKKIRNPGVDFIRMIAMNGIIINHLVYQGNGIFKFAEYKK